MKLKTFCFALAVLGAASPSFAQTNATKTKAAPQVAPLSTTESLIMEATRNLRVVSGPRPRTPQQKARESAALDRINDLTQAGTEALHNKNFVVAEVDYRELIQAEPLFYNYYGLGEALAGQGKVAEALAAYKTAVYWPLNTSPEAVAVSQAIENKPNLRGCCGPIDSIAWMKYALLLTQTGQNSEALSVYTQALRYVTDVYSSGIVLFPNVGSLSPAAFQAAVHLALGLLAGGVYNDSEGAMTEFETALRLTPGSSAANYYYGYGWRQLDPKSKTRAADAVQAKVALTKAAASEDAHVKKAAAEAMTRMP